jgi:hypothetical protein
LPLVDLTVEDPPLEEVMQDLFASHRPQEAASVTGVTESKPVGAQ